jgi:hypothetical protein
MAVTGRFGKDIRQDDHVIGAAMALNDNERLRALEIQTAGFSLSSDSTRKAAKTPCDT